MHRAFTHGTFYTQVFYTETFAREPVTQSSYTQEFLSPKAFTHQRLYMNALTQKRFGTAFTRPQSLACPPTPPPHALHPRRPHRSAQVRTARPAHVRWSLLVPHLPISMQSVRTPPRSYARSCPLASSTPNSFPSIPLCLHLYTHPHLRSLISTEPFSPPIYPHFLLPAPPHSSRSPLVSSPHKLPSVPLPPHRPQWFAQLRLLMSTGIFPTHPFPFIPLQQHHPHSSALVRASTLADLHPTFFSPRHFPSIHLSPHRPHSSATLAHWSLRPTHFPPFP